jgi:hypothetical protein
MIDSLAISAQTAFQVVEVFEEANLAQAWPAKNVSRESVMWIY